MGASEVVSQIATRISEARAPLSPREAFLIHLLRGTPLFRDLNRLDLWEHCYKQIVPEGDATQTESIIDATFWLAGEFLYGAFVESEARRYFAETLDPPLRASGIEIDDGWHFDLADW